MSTQQHRHFKHGHPRRTAPATVAAASVALVLVGACDPAESPGAAIATDSAGVQIVTSDPLRSDATCTLGEAPIFRVGDDESDEAQFFSSIRGLGRFSDGSVAVVDRADAEVRIFDADGRHLRSMGRYGEGPGEFNDAWKLWVLPGDTLWVGDYRPWRYNVFTSDGEWVRAVQMDPAYPNPSRRGGVLDNGISVNTVEQWPSARDFSVPVTVVVEAHRPDGELIGTLARVPSTVYGEVSTGESSTNMYQLFSASAVVEAGGSTIATAHTAEAEVRLLDSELRLSRIVRWSHPDRDVTAADVRAWREDYIESRGGRNSPNWRPSDDVIVSDEVPAADVFPALSLVEIGRDGRVWVLPYQRPGAEPPRWMGFEPDGNFLCHLEIPLSGLTTYEFGADYWLGVHADELGIETVVVYRLLLSVEGG